MNINRISSFSSNRLNDGRDCGVLWFYWYISSYWCLVVSLAETIRLMRIRMITVEIILIRINFLLSYSSCDVDVSRWCLVNCTSWPITIPNKKSYSIEKETDERTNGRRLRRGEGIKVLLHIYLPKTRKIPFNSWVKLWVEKGIAWNGIFKFNPLSTNWDYFLRHRLPLIETEG